MSSRGGRGRGRRASGGGGGGDAPTLEPLGRDELSSFDPMEVIACTVDDLIPAVPLKDVVAAGGKFRIVGHYTDKFNLFDIMSVDVKNDEEFRMNEELMEVVENCDADVLTRPADLKQVVLAPVNRKLFKRAVVLKKDKNQVLVHFVDAGGRAIVEICKLRPITKGIMKYPILSYHVGLDNMPDTSFLFTRDDFAGLMNKLTRVDMSVVPGEELKRKGILSISTMVSLSYEKDGVKTSLLDEITELKKWEWEKFSELKGNDDEICEKGAFGTASRSSDEKIIFNLSLKVGTRFTAVVSRVVPDENDPINAVLHLVLLDEQACQNYFEVLHRQMQRYSTFISKSPFFPAINERLMFKMVTNARNKLKYEKLVKVVDKWCRGVRLDDAVYLFDTDDTVPFLALPPADYDIRRIYGEFFKVPILTVKVHVKRGGKPIAVGSATEIFQPRLRYSFEISKVRDRGEYDADFLAVNVARRFT